MNDVNLQSENTDGGIRGHSKTSIMKNRWTADLLATVIAAEGHGRFKIDMAGEEAFVARG